MWTGAIQGRMSVFEEVRAFASPGPDSHPRSAPQGVPLCGSGLPSFISNQPASPCLLSAFLPKRITREFVSPSPLTCKARVAAGAPGASGFGLSAGDSRGSQFRTPCPALSFRPQPFSLLFLVQYPCTRPHRSHPTHRGSGVAAPSESHPLEKLRGRGWGLYLPSHNPRGSTEPASLLLVRKHLLRYKFPFSVFQIKNDLGFFFKIHLIPDGMNHFMVETSFLTRLRA